MTRTEMTAALTAALTETRQTKAEIEALRAVWSGGFTMDFNTALGCLTGEGDLAPLAADIATITDAEWPDVDPGLLTEVRGMIEKAHRMNAKAMQLAKNAKTRA